MGVLSTVIAFFFILVTTFQIGFFSFGGLMILFCAFTLLWIVFFSFQKAEKFEVTKEIVRPDLSLLLLCSSSLALFYSSGMYQSAGYFSILMTFLPLLVFPVIVTYLFPYAKLQSKTRSMRFTFLILAALTGRMLMLAASPAPRIDVFTMLKEAPLALFSGVNPYDVMYSPVYAGVESSYFTYWPAAFLLELPFVLITHDPRVLLVLADIAAALLVWNTGKRTHWAEVLALIFLYRPNAFFVIEQSWLTSVEVLLLTVSVILSLRQKNSPSLVLPAGAVMALLVGTKFTYIFALPFVILLYRKRFSFLVSFAVTLALIVGPFFLWNPQSFKADTIDFFARSASQMKAVPVHASLNINTAAFLFTGHDIPRYLMSAVFFLIFGIIFFQYLKRLSFFTDQNERGALCFLGLTIVFTGFYLLNLFSFLHYYYAVTGMFFTFLALTLQKKPI